MTSPTHSKRPLASWRGFLLGMALVFGLSVYASLSGSSDGFAFHRVQGDERHYLDAVLSEGKFQLDESGEIYFWPKPSRVSRFTPCTSWHAMPMASSWRTPRAKWATGGQARCERQPEHGAGQCRGAGRSGMASGGSGGKQHRGAQGLWRVRQPTHGDGRVTSNRATAILRRQWSNWAGNGPSSRDQGRGV